MRRSRVPGLIRRRTWSESVVLGLSNVVWGGDSFTYVCVYVAVWSASRCGMNGGVVMCSRYDERRRSVVNECAGEAMACSVVMKLIWRRGPHGGDSETIEALVGHTKVTDGTQTGKSSERSLSMVTDRRLVAAKRLPS